MLRADKAASKKRRGNGKVSTLRGSVILNRTREN